MRGGGGGVEGVSQGSVTPSGDVRVQGGGFEPGLGSGISEKRIAKKGVGDKGWGEEFDSLGGRLRESVSESVQKRA